MYDQLTSSVFAAALFHANFVMTSIMFYSHGRIEVSMSFQTWAASCPIENEPVLMLLVLSASRTTMVTQRASVDAILLSR